MIDSFFKFSYKKGASKRFLVTFPFYDHDDDNEVRTIISKYIPHNVDSVKCSNMMAKYTVHSLYQCLIQMLNLIVVFLV